MGISGREGRAAVLASDFAIGQFRFLPRLLLLHGRWAYLRNAEAVKYAFYKNVVYTLPLIYFALVSGEFGGQAVAAGLSGSRVLTVLANLE